MNGSESSTVPPPTSVLFARGVIARLATWDILRVAVQESWGGPGSSAKRTWLASEIVDAFEQQSPVPDDQYIEEMLLQVIADEFDAIVEDGSGEGVAVDIVRLWEETRLGKQDLVTKFEEAAEKLKGKKMIVEETEDEEWEDDEDEEGEGDEMDENEPPQLIERSLPRNPKPEPEVDEDGFTLVKGKNRR